MHENVTTNVNEVILTLKEPTLQNGQTHSNNSSAIADECLSVFDPFVGLALNGVGT